MSLKFLRPEQFRLELSKIFDELKPKLMALIPDCDVEHIGSSAINSAISKGDLDILVRVDKTALEITVKKIQTLGFSIKEGTLRTESLCMLITDKYSKDIAIQVIARGSKFEEFLAFRDILNQNPALVEAYNLLKQSCEGMSHEIYRSRKSQFVEFVLREGSDLP